MHPSLLRLCLPALAAIAAWPAAARPDSPACQGALAELERREQAVLAMPADVRPARAAPVLEQRRRAALACLDGPPDAPPRAGVAASPMPAAAPRRPMPPPAAPTTGAAAAPPSARPPLTLTSCDALGCWTSDGTRLQKIGPSLLGPAGPCTATGGFVRCP